MKYMIIENDLSLISHYDDIGVSRIFLDLEVIGKKERQGHLNTVITTHHSINDITPIKKILKNSQLLVRVNPLHQYSQDEIEACIQGGADILMLPMFKTTVEVEKFIGFINGRAKCCLLLETAEAFCRADDILNISGIDEVHIGLNDLHLSMNLDFIFEVLTGGLVEYLARKLIKKGIPYGFGGVATVEGGAIPGKLILSEHVRLGSQMVILSRDFKKIASNDMNNFKVEFNKIESQYKMLMKESSTVLMSNKSTLKEKLDIFLGSRKVNV